MRMWISSVVVVLGFLAFGAHPFIRPLPPPPEPTADEPASEPQGSEGSAPAPAFTADGGTTQTDGGVTGDSGPQNADQQDSLGRPLQVYALGHHLAAAGLLANGGPQSSDVHISVARTVAEISEALAQGGAGGGADVALVPLPEMVASLDSLRALEPRIFLITGWSTGHEALSASAPLLQGATGSSDILVSEPETTSAAFFSLFIMDLWGVPPEQVRFVRPAEQRSDEETEQPEAEQRDYVLSTRPWPARRQDGQALDRATISTRHARSLIPFVAVASAGFVASHRDALLRWAERWLQGQRLVEGSLPEAARFVAALDEAPQALTLLTALDSMSGASAGDNARLFGLAGRSPLRLDDLLDRASRLLTSAGYVSSVPPGLIYPDVVLALARRGRDHAEPAADSPPPTTELETVLAWQPKIVASDPALLDELAFVAGVFAGQSIAVETSGGQGTAEQLVEAVTSRFELDPARFALGSTPPTLPPTVTLEVRTAQRGGP